MSNWSAHTIILQTNFPLAIAWLGLDSATCVTFYSVLLNDHAGGLCKEPISVAFWAFTLQGQ